MILDDDLEYPTTLTKMQIGTGNNKCITLGPCKILLAHITWLDEHIDKLLKAGIIRYSTFPLRVDSDFVLTQSELCVNLM